MKIGEIKDVKDVMNEVAIVMSETTGHVTGPYDANKFTDEQVLGCINLIRKYVASLNEVSRNDELQKYIEKKIESKNITSPNRQIQQCIDKRIEYKNINSRNKQIREQYIKKENVEYEKKDYRSR